MNRSLNGLQGSTRSLNGLEGECIEKILSGSAINVVETSINNKTINVDISKQIANSGAFADTDLFLLETSAGDIKKITGTNMKTGSFSSNWTRSAGNIFPTITGDTILANNKIEIDTIADATYVDSLILKNTNEGEDILTYSYQIKDAGSTTAPDFGGKLNFEVVYTKGSGTTNNVFEVLYEGSMIIKKRLQIDNGFYANSGEEYDFPLTGGKLVVNTSGSITGTLPISVSTAGVVSTAFTTTSVDNMSNKTFTTATTFNKGVYVKYDANTTTSGFVRFYEATDNGSNYIDLHPQGHSISSSINVFLPNSVNNTILVGRDTTDTLTNKTITQFTGNSSAVITTPSTTGTLALEGDTTLWTRSSGNITPTTTTDILEIPSGQISLYNATEGYYIKSDYTTNKFEIKEKDGSLVFDYDHDTGFVNFGSNIASQRMNFGNYILMGGDTSYPTGATDAVATITSVYSRAGYFFTLETDQITINSSGSPATTNSNINCNTSGYIYFSQDKLQIGEIGGTVNPSSNYIVENTSYGWTIGGVFQEYCLRLGGTSGAVYLGDDSGSFQLHIEGTGDAYKVGADLQHLFYGNGLTCANSRFKANYSASRCFLTNPSGTNQAVSFAGSFLAYHDNGTELHFNNPNSSYDETNSSNISFSFAGYRRQTLFGSTIPAVSYYKADGATIYSNIGMGSTFPANVGQWSSISNPMGHDAFFIAGANTNDAEGYFFAGSGQGSFISSTGDVGAFTWFDEDYAPNANGWYISVSGSIFSISDKRFKTDIKTYKNSNFEKYKQIRTITYKKKKPTLSQKRLEKKSCIEKYNNIHYGVVAQELYSLYPELETTEHLTKEKEWEYRRDNWDKGVYEKEYNEWKIKKEEYEKCNCEENCEQKFNEKEPKKIFNIEQPHKTVDYQRLNILTIGVVQDLIKTVEDQKKEIDILKEFMNELITAKSFAEFKKKIS